MRYDLCPLCKKHLEIYPDDQRICINSVCNSGFTDWGENNYYFVRSYKKRNRSLPTDFIIETFPDVRLTRIMLAYYFNRDHMASINKIYNLIDLEELNSLLKIVDRIYSNFHFR